MLNEDLEAELASLSLRAPPYATERRSAELAALGVYADWLEERGRVDMAQALRAFRPQAFRPVSLRVMAPDDEPAPPGRYERDFPDLTLPLELFVIDELFPRNDQRYLEDRKDIALSLDNFDRVLSDQRIVVRLDRTDADIGEGSIDLRVDRFADLEPSALAAQLSERGVAADRMHHALRAVATQTPWRQVERVWRSLRWLLERIAEPVRLAVVNGSVADIVADIDDASTLAKSGFFRMINNHNHPGMRPSGAIVLGPTFEWNAQHIHAIRACAEIARMKSLPLLAAPDIDPCGPADRFERTRPMGRHVTMAGPSFVLRPAHAFEDAPLLGSASYLAAARMAAAFSRHWGGGGLEGTLDRVQLARPTGRSRAIFAAQRGFVELVAQGDTAELFVGATASPNAGGTRSLDVHVIGCRMGLQLQNLHFRRLWRRSSASAVRSDAALVAAELERGLRARLVDASDLRFALRDARFEEPPTADGQFDGALRVALAMDLPAATGQGVVHHEEDVTVRLGF